MRWLLDYIFKFKKKNNELKRLDPLIATVMVKGRLKRKYGDIEILRARIISTDDRCITVECEYRHRTGEIFIREEKVQLGTND